MTENLTANTIAPNEFLAALADLVRAETEKDSRVAKLRTVRARFEKMGCNMRALDLLLKLRRMEDEDAEALLRDALRYCRWAAMPLGNQPGLFSDDAPLAGDRAAREWSEAQAREEGYKAGKAGRDATDGRFAAGTPHYAAFYAGWVDGQRVIADQLGVEFVEGTGTLKKPGKAKADADGAESEAAPATRKPGRRGSARLALADI